MKLYSLESVGAVVNEAGIAYPMHEDGTPDLDNGTDLSDIEAGEWWTALSNEDRAGDIDVGDILRDPDAIKDIKIKTKAVRS